MKESTAVLGADVLKGQYEGDWKENRKHGKGIFKFDDGYVYEGNWENRGIGTLLLGRVESWAISHGIKLILGSLSPSDHIEKLKYFYPKHGWVIEIPSKSYILPYFVMKGVGIVYKRLQPLSKTE